MERLPLKTLKANPNNPRVIRDEKFKKLVKSIQEFPEMLEARPVVVNPDMVVLGGNMRLKALREAGVEEAPVYIASWDEVKQRQFIIKDNVGFGEWDWDALANEWNEEELQDWGLDIPGFEEMQEVLEAEEDDFDVPDEIKTDIVPGDLFEIGEHRLLCGDSTDSDQVAKLMDGQKADMVFTDPPYGMKLDTDYTSMSPTSLKHSSVLGDNEDFAPELINTIFACFGDVKEIFIWGADYFAELIPSRTKGSLMVWDKRSDEDKIGLLDGAFGSDFELCWSKVKHKREIVRILRQTGHHEARSEDKRVHPTQKPCKLARWFFNKWGGDDDLIADLFLGSGSTMVAAHQLGRKCYGMELDPKYCQVIVDRMHKLDPSLQIKRNGQPYEPND